MGEFLRHFSSGMRNAIVVGTPDFNINNQYTDIINIGKDMKTSIIKVTTNEQRKTATGNLTKERKQQLRSKRHTASIK